MVEGRRGRNSVLCETELDAEPVFSYTEAGVLLSEDNTRACSRKCSHDVHYSPESFLVTVPSYVFRRSNVPSHLDEPTQRGAARYRAGTFRAPLGQSIAKLMVEK